MNLLLHFTHIPILFLISPFYFISVIDDISSQPVHTVWTTVAKLRTVDALTLNPSITLSLNPFTY
jgi:hypothetical protein